MSDEAPNNKVVVVEDDAAILDLLADELRENGFQPLVLRRGGAVVKTVKDEKPGAVILDLALPDRDGTHILRDLKDDWDAKKTPVIVISAYTGRLDHKGRENAEAVFPKPFDLHELMNAVRAAVMKPKD
ncbi:MAG TPA: response regulator [Chloroflexota bacterium]|nr:response regulator [Chloroflexota bacterium]